MEMVLDCYITSCTVHQLTLAVLNGKLVMVPRLFYGMRQKEIPRAAVSQQLSHNVPSLQGVDVITSYPHRIRYEFK